MLTLIVVTRNGAKTLPRLFDALTRVESPDGGFKIVLADNGSTDATKQIVEHFQSSLPIRYIFEPNNGQNTARNKALEYREGHLVVFTDDDTIPESDWLVSLDRGAATHPDMTIFGGDILPNWETAPPKWILKEVDLGACFALSDPDRSEGECDASSVWGPNMAVRSHVFDEGHQFDETIGPKGTNYAMGSDTEFTTRLAKLGHRAWFCKGARVSHFVRVYQLKREWILGRAVRFGRGHYRLELRDSLLTGPTVFGMPSRAIRHTIKQFLRIGWAYLVRRDRMFREYWRLNFLLGYLTEARNHSKIDSEPTIQSP